MEVTLAFVGYATAAMAERAAAFEDEVLALLERHGGRVLHRARRVGDDASLPAEVQVLSFPSREAFAAFLADDRRAELIAEHGEVFTAKQAVEVTQVTGTPRPRFVVVREAGPAWDHGRPMREQAAWDEHAAFMDALAEDGFIELGGPVGGRPGALHVVRARSEDEVATRFAEDPWSRMGLLRTASAEPWEVLLGG